jgi:U3 small nucleolar RNA-associated protein 18
MAPSTRTASERNTRGRSGRESTTDAPKFRPELDLDPSDSAEAALQVVNSASQPEWEGFEEADTDDEEDDDESSSESSIESSDDASEDIVVEKKKEKPVLPKGAEEEELERIVFGDSAGFKEGIDSFSLKQSAGPTDTEQAADSDDEDGYANAADHDLFFFDAGPTAAPARSLAVAHAEDSEQDEDKPAWEDSDDERLAVSLASVPQLRKLRETADDDMVDGNEYMRRLRIQYERLYPTPEWAIAATGKAKRKRRHTLEDGDSDEGSASDMDVDEEDLSTLPLARLLQDADILSRTSRGPAKRRKLQAGTVDIQRLKDVSRQGPVRTFAHNVPLLAS